MTGRSIVDLLVGCPEPGDRVVHPGWGTGRVSALVIDGNYVAAIVRFDDGVRREVISRKLTVSPGPPISATAH